jgi:hypothetical protein
MRNKKFKVIFMGTIFLTCFTYTINAIPKFEKSIDTFTVEMTKPHFDSTVSHWIEKINGKVLPCTVSACDTLPPYYSTGLLRTGLFIKTENLNNNYLKVNLTHVWNRGYRSFALFRTPNVSYTLKQELGLPNDIGQNINDKSYWTFLGLTLLNSGIGMAYASYKSPFSYETIPFTILYTLMDAALTAGLFIDDKGVRGFSAIFLPAAKAAVCIRVIFIREHNKFAKTGYKFILQRK